MLRPIAKKILDILLERNLTKLPVMFHVFSNGGGVLYRYVSELVRTNEKYHCINVTGAIFDSCPAPRSIVTGLKGIFANFHPKNKCLKFLMMWLCVTFMIVSRQWRDITRLLGIDTEAAKQRYWEAMRDDPNHWPQMYLYSLTDRVVHYTDIARMINERRARGVRVHARLWERSPHVSHLRFHPQEYVEACHRFLQACHRKYI